MHLACLLDRTFFRLSLLPERLARLRYFRGHGVHSPFAYAIVRQVFMRSTLNTDASHGTDLFRQLRQHGISHSEAVQLANLCTHCGYESVSVSDPAEGAGMIIVPREIEPAAFPAYVQAACRNGGTLVVMQPYRNRRRAAACRELVAAHRGMSIDKRSYLLLFNDEKLPKQHYRI